MNTYDLKTKVNRGIWALIVGTGAGGATAANTFSGQTTSNDRGLPNTSIDAGEGIDESNTGNLRFHSGRIVFRDEAGLQPNEQEPTDLFFAARQRVDAIIGQLVQSTDPPAGQPLPTEMDASRELINQYGNALAVDPSNGANAVMAASAQANADMADFSLLYWRVTDVGHPVKDGREGVSYYERVMHFECVAANTGGLG